MQLDKSDRCSAVWPLVGRDAEVDRLCAVLTAGNGGVLLVGDAGVGKSRLAAAALDACERAGQAVVRVIGTPGWQEVPFGALVGLVQAAPADVADAFRYLAGRLGELVGARPVVVGVDDAHWLDESSAALLERLVADGVVSLLAVVRTDMVAAMPSVLARRIGDLRRMDVSALNRSDLRELIGGALGGVVDGLTHDVLWQLTLGNPLFVREVLRHACDTGAVALEDGLWVWRGEQETPLRLGDMVAWTVRGLSEAERAALTYVAYAEPIPLTMLEHLVDSGAAERLEERGLIRLGTVGGSFSVRLGHPMYGEAVRAGIGSLRARRVLRELADVMERPGATAEDRLRAVSWRCQAGLPVEEKDLVVAVEDALLRGGAALAHRLAGHLPAPLDVWHQGRAAVALGRCEEADAQLAAAYTELTDPADRARAAALRALNLFWGLRQPEVADAVLAEATRALPAEVRHELFGVEAAIAVFCGRGPEALEAISVALSQPSIDPLLATAVAPLRPYLLVFAGAPALAAAEFDAGELPIPQIWATMRAATQSCHVHALVMCGRLAEAAEICGRYYHDAVASGSPDAVGLLAMMSGVCAGDAGRLREAVRWAAEARAVTDARTLFPVRANILAMQAWWASHLGDFDDARRTLAEAVACLPDGGAADYAAVSEAWLIAMSGERVRAVQLLSELGARFADAGLVAMAIEALQLLCRVAPSAPAAAELRRVAGLSDSPLFAWYADYAEVVLDGDPGRLEQASEEWQARGFGTLALEAAARAAAAYGDTDRRAAARLGRRVEQLRDECDGFWPAWLPRNVPARGLLTERELEVCTLAAAGLGNTEIAERLVLSVRTVENHLQRSYEKLGVRGRRELRSAVAPTVPAE
ncbi:AAA ATPase-like protein [Krasilnikovia cinnamomea]|uniref:AAA ATPase-like protein n=1 Tax=Krasilnikovia cinnamomea TaxID=349313 RepID=A0A4Q7ZMT1_9ACTN|nr:LuxR family transcriptional regulator [Krasilnikovia cinnamomea]RZU52320.1 AAA ATPase-like protein [Krasilnikovia cinnamomea]